MNSKKKSWKKEANRHQAAQKDSNNIDSLYFGSLPGSLTGAISGSSFDSLFFLFTPLCLDILAFFPPGTSARICSDNSAIFYLGNSPSLYHGSTSPILSGPYFLLFPSLFSFLSYLPKLYLSSCVDIPLGSSNTFHTYHDV